MPDRLAPPGISFLKEQPLTAGGRQLLAGMARPTIGPDDWWLAILWVRDEDGIIAFRDVAPAAGPPPDPPLARLGVAMSGNLSGLILEDEGRLSIRLGLVSPPDAPDRPWRCPLAIRAGFRFEPARVATMTANGLANEVLTAFRQGIEALGGRRPAAA
ncbi:MAG: hypothetical protein ABIV26_09225 [Candidatus Limnocylindrales bacterium]